MKDGMICVAGCKSLNEILECFREAETRGVRVVEAGMTRATIRMLNRTEREAIDALPDGRIGKDTKVFGASVVPCRCQHLHIWKEARL